MAQNIMYFRNSWRLLTAEKGWIKSVLLLALAQFVPVVGGMAVYGYGLAWARESAWGIQRPFRTQDKDSQTMRTGAFAWVFLFVFELVSVTLAIVLWFVFSFIPFIGLFIGLIFSMVVLLVAPVAPVFGMASTLRGAIYDGLAPSFQVHRTYRVVSRDLGGFLRIAAIYVIGVIITLIVVTILILVAILVAILVSMDSSAGNSAALATGIMGPIGFILLTLVAIFLASIVMVPTTLITYHALGTWIEQYKPAVWGPYNQPIPTITYATPSYRTAPTYAPPAQAVAHAQTAPPAQPSPAAQSAEPVSPVDAQPQQHVESSPAFLAEEPTAVTESTEAVMPIALTEPEAPAATEQPVQEETGSEEVIMDEPIRDDETVSDLGRIDPEGFEPEDPAPGPLTAPLDEDAVMQPDVEEGEKDAPEDGEPADPAPGPETRQ